MVQTRIIGNLPKPGASCGDVQWRVDIAIRFATGIAQGIALEIILEIAL